MRASEIIARRDQHLAAAENRAAVDRLLDGRRIFRGAVALGAEIADVQDDARRCGGR